MELQRNESPISLQLRDDDSTDNDTGSEDTVSLSGSNATLSPMDLKTEFGFYKDVARTLLEDIVFPNEKFMGQQLLLQCEDMFSEEGVAIQKHAMRFLNALLPAFKLAAKKPRDLSFLGSWFARFCYPPNPQTQLEHEEWLLVGSIYIAFKGMDDGKAIFYLSISDDTDTPKWRANGMKAVRERTEYDLRARK